MRPLPRAPRFVGGCVVFLLSAAGARAEPPAPCAAPGAPACGGPPPKVVVHLPPPEVVTDQPAARGRRCFPLFAKHRRQPAPATTTVTHATVLSPLDTLTQGLFVNQSLATGLGLSAVNFGAAGTAGLEMDFPEIRAAQELELMAARVAAIQAMRETEARIQAASLQRVQAQIAGISSAYGLRPASEPFQAGPRGAADPNLQAQIAGINERLTRLENKIKEVGDLCTQIGVKLKE